MMNVLGFAWGKCGGVVFERLLRLYLQTQSICHVVQPHFTAELGLELHRIPGLPRRSLDCLVHDVRIAFAEMKHGTMCEFVPPIALVPGKAMCQFWLVYLGSGFFRKYASVGWVARGKTSFLDPTLGSYCFMHQFGTGQTILAAPGPDPTIPRSHVFNTFPITHFVTIRDGCDWPPGSELMQCQVCNLKLPALRACEHCLH